MQVPDWVRDYYALVDSGDGAGALAAMAEDVHVRVGSRPPATGRDEAAATLRAFHANFARVSHEILAVWEDGDTTICEFTASYTLHDGSLLALPSLTVLRREEGQITHMRVYIDDGPIGERAAARPAADS
jgi:ketosteroid isomerase-like protein